MQKESSGNMNIVDVRGTLPLNPDPNRRYALRTLNNIVRIVLHCDDMDADLMTIANFDVTPRPDHPISPLGDPGFTYHYFIEKDGTKYFTQDLEEVTWHVGGYNLGSVGICIRYHATGNHNPPPDIQLESVYELITSLCLSLGLEPDDVVGHRELLGTGYRIVNGKKVLRKTCPGLLVSMSKTRYTVSMQIQKALKDAGFYKGAMDGIFGPLSKKAFKQYKSKGN